MVKIAFDKEVKVICLSALAMTKVLFEPWGDSASVKPDFPGEWSPEKDCSW